MIQALENPTIHCTICGENKELSEFYPSSRGSKNGQCKSCVKKRTQDREEERVKAGLSRRSSKKRAKNPKSSSPPSVSAESLMKALAGGAADPSLEAAMQIVAMQQKTVELLLGRRK